MRRKKHSNCKFSYSRNLYYICATINLSLIEFFDYSVGISHPSPFMVFTKVVGLIDSMYNLIKHIGGFKMMETERINDEERKTKTVETVLKVGNLGE